MHQPRICCACGRQGHHSHECPDGEAIRQQYRNPPPEPKPEPAEEEIAPERLKGWNGY